MEMRLKHFTVNWIFWFSVVFVISEVIRVTSLEVKELVEFTIWLTWIWDKNTTCLNSVLQGKEAYI